MNINQRQAFEIMKPYLPACGQSEDFEFSLRRDCEAALDKVGLKNQFASLAGLTRKETISCVVLMINTLKPIWG